MLLVEMPAARPHHQRGRDRCERIPLPLGTGEGNGAPHRVPQVHLALEIVAPGRSVRVLEVCHVDPRARIERVDDHLPVHGACDLDPTVSQIGGNRRDGPGRFPHCTGLWEEVGKLAGVEAALALYAPCEQLLAARLARSRQCREEAARVGGQDTRKSWLEGRAHLESSHTPRRGSRHTVNVALGDGQFHRGGQRAGASRNATPTARAARPSRPLMSSAVWWGRSATTVHSRRGSRRESSNDLAPPLPAFPPDSSYCVRPRCSQTSCHVTSRGEPLQERNSVALLPQMCPPPAQLMSVGRSVPRREGGDKVTGRARYTDDLVVPGAWYGCTIRSTIARGRIRSISM